jgi:Fe-S-cluster-containing dehydrogenase component
VTGTSALPLEDTRPCIGCGMCCDGTLYGLAKVAPGEDARMRDTGLDITSVGDRSYFRQPCPMHSCGSCTIYQNRFEICRSFRCALLKRYHAGNVSLEEAREKVRTAKQLLESVVAQDLDAAHADGRRRMRTALADWKSVAGEQAQLKAARRVLDMVALDAFLDRWFRNKNFQVEELDEVATADSNS